ncbi:hypothetical protein BDB01DRAFT_797214 [Pilobolus umbonatus]|nr:hypothetical protein BDB01DRAFT_797214 [Pilobolus umbonatus]
MTSTSNKTKTLKWTTQRVNTNKSPNRVHKRTPSRSVQTSNKKKAIANISPREETEALQNELEFTYDSLATISVHFESLHHAYISSKAELDKSKSATRLGEKEKELLTAYDDLGLQVNHLEKKLEKINKRMEQLKSGEHKQLFSVQIKQEVESPITKYSPVISSSSSTASSCDISSLEYSPILDYEYPLMHTMYNQHEIYGNNDQHDLYSHDQYVCGYVEPLSYNCDTMFTYLPTDNYYSDTIYEQNIYNSFITPNYSMPYI